MTLTRRSLMASAFATAAVGALTSCSTSPSTPGTTGGQDTTIRFSIWFGEGDIDVWKSVIAKFEQANPSIKVKFEPLEYGSFWTKLNTQFAGGTAPDVMGMQFQQATLGTSGQLAPLGDAVGDDLSKMPDTLAKVGQADDNGTVSQFALPWRFVGSCLYGNLTAMEKAGISTPSTWSLDDFVAAAKEMTGGSNYGTAAPSGSMTVPIASSFGAAPVSADGKTATYNSDSMIAAMTFMRDLVYVHKVAPKPSDVSTQKDPFATGSIMMRFQGSWNIPVYRKIKDFDWDILPNPNGNQPAKNYAGPDMIAVYAKSKAKQAAEAFVKYAVFERDAQELIGTTGLPVLTEYLTDPKRVESETKLKPDNYKYFVDQANTNAEGWAFVPKFADIGKISTDTEFKIYSKADSDIPAILNEANTGIQAALDSSR